MKRLLLHNGHTLAKGNTNPLTASLREQVVRGVFWSFGSRIWTQLFQVTFGIILARLLSPEEFGIIGMLLVFIGFAQALADGGLSSALIYHQDAGTTHQSTVFWLQLVAGATLSILFFTAAPLLANFYAVPPLIPLGQLLSCREHHFDATCGTISDTAGDEGLRRLGSRMASADNEHDADIIVVASIGMEATLSL